MLIRINNPDDGAIGGRIFTLKGKARFLSTAPKDQLTYSCAHGIYCDQRFSLWAKILIKRLDNQKLAPL